MKHIGDFNQGMIACSQERPDFSNLMCFQFGIKKVANTQVCNIKHGAAYVFPNLSVPDSVHSNITDIEALGNYLAMTTSAKRLNDISNLIVSQLRQVAFLPTGYIRPTSIPSAFFDRIEGIVAPGSKKQMFRITAWWVITFVADKNVVRDLAVSKDISQPVGQDQFASIEHQTAIALLVSIPLPLPAFIRTSNVNLLPEPFVQGPWFLKPLSLLTEDLTPTATVLTGSGVGRRKIVGATALIAYKRLAFPAFNPLALVSTFGTTKSAGFSPIRLNQIFLVTDMAGQPDMLSLIPSLVSFLESHKSPLSDCPREWDFTAARTEERVFGSDPSRSINLSILSEEAQHDAC